MPNPPRTQSAFGSLLALDAFPRTWRDRLHRWLGEGIIHSPVSFERCQTLGIVSSHLGAEDFASARWQLKLRSAIRVAKQSGRTVLFACDTPYAIPILNACRKFNVPFLGFTLELVPEGESANKARIGDTNFNRESEMVRIRLTAPTRDQPFAALPAHDRGVVALSDQLFVLELKETGKIAKLLTSRLLDKEAGWGNVYIAETWEQFCNTAKKRFRCHWLDIGAVDWICKNESFEKPMNSLSSCCNRLREETATRPIAPILRMRDTNIAPGAYLIHCTRARRGPWPDQSIQQYRDELLHSPWQTKPTPLDSLIRILQTKRLIATSMLKSSLIPSVSFSACELTSLLQSRKFESHLARWDWEPYGIAIRRDWIIKLGGKEVLYKKKNQHHSREKSPLVQSYDDAGNGRDWRSEMEWRIVSDVRLAEIPFHSGFVFVRTPEEARAIEHLSRWPIIVTEPNDGSH